MELGYELTGEEVSIDQERFGSEPPAAGRGGGPATKRIMFPLRPRWASAVKIGIHLLLVPVAYYFAYSVRFDFDIPSHHLETLLRTLPVLLAIRFAAFALFRVDRGWWRYVSVVDLVSLLKACTASTVAVVLVLFLAGQLKGLPRSILFLDWAFTLLLIGGTRLSVRVALQENGFWKGMNLHGRTPVVIVGAGDAAERLVRELHRDRTAAYAPLALVDDDPAKVGMSMHGVRVRGTTDQLAAVAENCGATLAIIAAPSATRQQIQQIVRHCKQANLRCQIVPSLPELLTGSAKLSQPRDVQIEDLLGRGTVTLDLSLARENIAGKVVLVTGGAGSIGSELARQVAALGPKRLVLVDQAESPLYFVDRELREKHPGLELEAVIADVCDQERMADVFRHHRPWFVFHAAAYKHVPLMEHNVVEAVRNNVLGTLRVAEAAAKWGAEKFVLISTDKAVRPSSVMGATKRIAERIVLGWPSLVASRTDFRAVRFGNVLGSAGSVIPVFKDQLAKGGPLTVTHPEVTRYFMTIPEASRLVLLAGTLPEAAGRISMLEMGEPVKIADLAENLIRLSGLEPGVDVEVRYTGLRPGEKLNEELMSAVEATVPTGVEKIRVVQTDDACHHGLRTGIDRLVAAVALGRMGNLLPAIGDLVPECVQPLRGRVRHAVAAVPAEDLIDSDLDRAPGHISGDEDLQTTTPNRGERHWQMVNQ